MTTSIFLRVNDFDAKTIQRAAQETTNFVGNFIPKWNLFPLPNFLREGILKSFKYLGQPNLKNQSQLPNWDRMWLPLEYVHLSSILSSRAIHAQLTRYSRIADSLDTIAEKVVTIAIATLGSNLNQVEKDTTRTAFTKTVKTTLTEALEGNQRITFGQCTRIIVGNLAPGIIGATMRFAIPYILSGFVSNDQITRCLSTYIALSIGSKIRIEQKREDLINYTPLTQQELTRDLLSNRVIEHLVNNARDSFDEFTELQMDAFKTNVTNLTIESQNLNPFVPLAPPPKPEATFFAEDRPFKTPETELDPKELDSSNRIKYDQFLEESNRLNTAAGDDDSKPEYYKNKHEALTTLSHADNLFGEKGRLHYWHTYGRAVWYLIKYKELSLDVAKFTEYLTKIIQKLRDDAQKPENNNEIAHYEILIKFVKSKIRDIPKQDVDRSKID